MLYMALIHIFFFFLPRGVGILFSINVFSIDCLPMDHLLYQIICLKMGPNSLVHRPQEICDALKGRLVSTLFMEGRAFFFY